MKADRIISAKGYGAAKLANNCDGTPACSEQKHEENRRIDFIIDQDTID